jgi:hypothetical protein
MTLFGVGLLLSWQTPYASAVQPLAVGLTSFEAFPLDSAVRLEWHTETEVNTVAFVVHRASGSSGFVWLTNLGVGGYIISLGGPAMGADYVETDDTAINGVTYTYRLSEVVSDGSQVELAMVTVTAGPPTSTPTPTPSPTPIVIDGNPNGPTSTPSPTQDRATVTPVPTNTPPLPAATPLNQGGITLTATRVVVVATVAPGSPIVTVIPDESVTDGGDAASQSATGTASAESPPPSGALTGVPVAIAQVQPQSTPDDGYPGLTPVPLVTEESSYPPGQVPPVVSPNLTPYPAGEGSNRSDSVSVIGSDQEGQEDESIVSQVTSEQLEGRVYLWVGFIIALIIFVASVIGSIHLFTRKRE